MERESGYPRGGPRGSSAATILSSSASSLSPTFSASDSIWSVYSSGSGSDTVTALTPSIRPIAIAPFSSPPAPAPLSFDSTSSFRSLHGGLIDGPLHELLPALSIAPSTSSSDESLALSVSNGPSSGAAKGGRRVVSAGLSAYLASPSRSSPLSRSVDEPSPDEPPWAARRAAFFGSPPSPPTTFDPLRLSSSRRRRRSSVSLSSSIGSSAPPFGSLVGSFENSLLAGRMSALPSRPLPFVASIGVLGGKDAPARLKCPEHLHVSFDAVFYCPPGEVHASSPYVGTIDLESHYHSVLSPTPGDSPTPKLPRFPGYQVPVRGQIQLVLKNSNRTAFKPFLIPYDLSGLDRSGKGGRTFLRQKSYAVNDNDARGRLRFAIHLQFCSPPASKNKGKSALEPKFYLYGTVRVVFAPHGLDVTDKLRVVLDGPALHKSSDSGAAAGDVERFSTYLGPGPEWEIARKKAKEREKTKDDALLPITQSDSTTNLHDTLSRYDIPLSTPVPAPYSSAPFAFAPLPAFSPSPLPAASPPLVSPSPLSFPPASAIPAPLTFERVPSPHRPAFLDARERKLSQSGLSASRPASRNEEHRTGSKERVGR
ncbi:hypothetical protein JCM8547_001613 [Rhodosporidiobolus lusitaniae]